MIQRTNKRFRFVRRFLPLMIASLLIVSAALTSSQTNENQNKGIIILDPQGTRGPVYFNHPAHQSRINPSPDHPFQARPGEACAGCHHSTNNRGVIQLVKCSACHFEPGNARNPVSKGGTELSADEAFHRNCLACHRANKQGPRLCSSCHIFQRTGSRGAR